MRKILINSPLYFRYHIGESLLPSVRHHLRFIGADDKVDSFGFFKKVRLVYMLSGTANYLLRMLSPVRRLNLINSNWKLVSFWQPSINLQQTLKLFLDTDFLAMGPNNYSWNVVRCIQ
jgi:hypothetical protein